jgi:hypothetical protein
MSLTPELKHQLYALRREDIEEAWDILRKATVKLSQAATLSFQRGQKVLWDSRRKGETVHGIVKKVNQRTVTVEVQPGGAVWRVSADMLRLDEGKEKG